MHNAVFGKKLSRTKNERNRLFSNLVRDLVLHGRIVTSRAKAKAVQPIIEKLVTKARKGRDVDRRLILKTLPWGNVADKLFEDAKDRFSQRTSGFTRMIKIGNIRSDGSEEVMLSFVDEAVKREPVVYGKVEKKEKVSIEKKDTKIIIKETKKPSKKTKTVKK